jgi:hypothetical protein
VEYGVVGVRYTENAGGDALIKGFEFMYIAEAGFDIVRV